MRALLFSLALVVSPAMAQITVTDAWTRASAPGANIVAGYMTIRNASKSADRLVAASSPLSQKVETHVTVKDGDIFRMREVKGYDIPASGTFELKPGGAHLMLVNVRTPLKEGDKVPVTLRFERAGEVKTEFHVGRLTDTTHSR